MALPKSMNNERSCCEKKRTIAKILRSLVMYLSMGMIVLLAIPGLILLGVIKGIWFAADKIVRMLDKY